MIAQFTTSTFENIYEILPTSLDDDKIKHVQDCVCIWLAISILSAGPMVVSLYSMFIVESFLPITVVSILFTIFSTVLTFSMYNFVLTHRYLLQLSILKSLTDEKESLSTRNIGETSPMGSVSF